MRRRRNEIDSLPGALAMSGSSWLQNSITSLRIWGGQEFPPPLISKDKSAGY